MQAPPATMQSPQPPKPSYFTDAYGDLFLASSDGIIFSLRRCILSLASIAWEAMLDSGVKQPIDEEDGTPDRPLVLDVPADVLDIIIRFIYPGQRHLLDFIGCPHLVFPLLQFCRKYFFEDIIEFVRDEIFKQRLCAPSLIDNGWDRVDGPVIPAVRPSLAEKEPLRVYAIAKYFEWAEANWVQNFCYRTEMLSYATELTPEWDHLRPAMYHELASNWNRVREYSINILTRFLHGAPYVEEEGWGDLGWGLVDTPWYWQNKCLCNDPVWQVEEVNQRKNKKGHGMKKRDERPVYSEAGKPDDLIYRRADISIGTIFMVPHWVSALHKLVLEEHLYGRAKPSHRFISSPGSEVMSKVEASVQTKCFRCPEHMFQHWQKVLKLENQLDSLA